MLNRYLVMKSASPNAMSQYIQTCVGKHRIRLIGEEGLGDSYIKHLPNKRMSFSVIKYGAEVEVSGPPQQGNYQIQLVLKGNCSINHCGQSVDLAPGEAAIINPSAGSSLVYRNGCEKLIITLDSDALQAKFTNETGIGIKAPLNFDLKVDKHKDEGYLTDLVKFYGGLADKQKGNHNFHLVNDMMTDSVISALLKCHANNYDYLLQHDSAMLPTYLKDAMEYIDLNLLEHIHAEDILGSIHVSERVLYKSFKDHLNTTPHAYIKSLRLKKIRQALIIANPEKVTVTDLALGFGFTHLGRFSQDYKVIFAELPSETLRRRSI